MNYRTKILHSGIDKDPYTGASSIPIYQGSTFDQEDPIVFSQYKYGRSSNPTRDALEHVMAELEGGAQGFAFSSGMAAISSVFLLFKTGDHIVVSEDVYGGTHRVLAQVFDRWGLRYTFADISTPEKARKAIKEDTLAIFAESPSNPTLKITDLRGLVRVARESNIVTIIDNTFMSPYFQRPIELGFDIVIHSATKFLSGHSDLIAGVATTREKKLGEKLKAIQVAFGAILGPQDCWLLMRGIKTLAARMEAQQRNAEVVASWLAEQTVIKKVYYPGLPSHPGRDVHLHQASGPGAVVSFELPTAGMTHAFLRSVTLPLLAVSLGGVGSTFLLKVCADVLGRKNVLAFIGQSPTCPEWEIEEAWGLAALIGAKYVIEETTEMWQRSLTCRIPMPWRKSSERSFFFNACSSIATS